MMNDHTPDPDFEKSIGSVAVDADAKPLDPALSDME